MKDWRRERWRKLFLRESTQQTVTWLLMQRGVRDYCIRIADDDGTVATVREDQDPVEAFVDALGAKARERDLALESVAGLLEDGFLAFEDGRVFVVNLPAAQSGAGAPSALSDQEQPEERAPDARTKAAERARRYRQNLKNRGAGDNGERDGSSRPVTEERHAPSRSITLGRHAPSRSTVTVPSVTVSRGNSQKEASESLLDQKDQREKPEQPDQSAHAGRDAKRDEGRDGKRDGQSVTERDVTREPTNLAEALALPITPRAKWIADGPGAARADWMQPHLWPEITAVADALAAATGKPSHGRLSSYGRDAGVRALVEAYATGWKQEELVRAVGFVVRSEWWTKDRATRGLSSLSPEVIRRAVAASEVAAPAKRPDLARAPVKTLEEQGFVPPPPGLLEELGLRPGTSPRDAVAAIVAGVAPAVVK